MRYGNRLYLSWDDIMAMIEYTRIEFEEAKVEVSGVYGIPRGGLILAVLLSHQLNIPLLQAPADNCIIVDDICDSGETLAHYISNSSESASAKNYHILTTIIRSDCKYIDKVIYRKVVEPGIWVQFPWEPNEGV